MDTTKTFSLRLDPSDFEQLQVEAKRPGGSPGAATRADARAGLRSEARERGRHRTGVEALDRLDALRAALRRDGYPSADAVAILRESRAELQQRPGLP